MPVSSVYPGTIPTYTTKVDKVDLVDDDHVNQLQVDVVAIATELGTDPAGTEVNVKTRLFVCIGDDGAIRKGTSFPSSPKEGQLFYRTDQDIMYIFDGSVWDSIAIPGDGTITQAKLSTTTGSASVQGSINHNAHTGIRLHSGGSDSIGISVQNDTGQSSVTLPGGQYSFYPETRVDASGYQGSDHTGFATNRYVTASGQDCWYFLLVADDGSIKATYFAEDHPSYGQRGDENSIPHPFPQFWNEPLPPGWEIILVEKVSAEELKTKKEYKDRIGGQKPTQEEIAKGFAIQTRGPMEAFFEEYEIDMTQEYSYEPLDIADEKGNHKFVTSIPSYIKMRRLVKL